MGYLILFNSCMVSPFSGPVTTDNNQFLGGGLFASSAALAAQNILLCASFPSTTRDVCKIYGDID